MCRFENNIVNGVLIRVHNVFGVKIHISICMISLLAYLKNTATLVNSEYNTEIIIIMILIISPIIIKKNTIASLNFEKIYHKKK